MLIGKNNSGKSSLLEAIFLLAGMSNPILPENINRIRGLKQKATENLKLLFYRLKLHNQPSFEGTFEDTAKRSLSLKPVYRKAQHQEVIQTISGEETTSDATTSHPAMTGLEFKFSIKQKHSKEQNFTNSIQFDPFEIRTNSSYKEAIAAVYITGSSNESNALLRYSEIVKRKKSDIVLNALQKIDPQIEAIHALPDGLYFNYRNIDELIPSNIAGDGVRKFLNIITTIAEKTNSIVLIDEIENGLHYTAHKSLWESILHLSEDFNVQLFITSHNLETLQCLKELLDQPEQQHHQEKIGIFTLAHTANAGIKTYKYTFNGFKEALNAGTEIRL